MSEAVSRGLLDTSVLIDSTRSTARSWLTKPRSRRKPLPNSVPAPTLPAKRRSARRQDRLQWAASRWDPLPVDTEVARAYGRVYAAVRESGRSSRRRFGDLLIAATALAHALPLYTRNPDDFTGLEPLVTVTNV